ncbi:AAA-ATPase Vps4-associated 1 family protein [Aspergillus stella-maris]|uniref:AAA-ATPase Vps4-associated 1 family protein n=1 Tax=Aspergillus stella-maris TaxID=1810926 RepID=UPI003CCDA5D7
MATTLPNTWHLRRVADTAAKACLICHKPSSNVLITPNNKDFFYVCPVHLKDRHFCSPIIDTEAEEAKRKEEAMAKEIENVTKEYEAKQKRKKEKKKEESKDKDQEKESDDKKTDTDKSDEKERDDKIDAIKNQSTTTGTPTDDGPRIFSLHKNFYQMRIDRMRNMEAAKRNRQRLQDPSFFPSAPSGGL